MALKELMMEDFLGKTVTHSFHQKNRIRGPNGSGKTSIKEAISFLFTGTDSAGNRNPQHLISTDKDLARITVITDKAEISRTLTRKGNGTLKLTRNGVSQALTQTQMETMIGSVDLFLSAFIPGYFLSLPSEKQHKLISEVSPKVDRLALVKELSGVELTPEERMLYALDRRVDLVANAVATTRRDFERQMAIKEGEIRQLEVLQPLPQPVYPTDCDRIEYLEQLQKAWTSYEVELKSYNNISARYERTKIENDLKESKRVQLKERLHSLKSLPIVRVKDRTADLSILNGQKRSHPARPAVGTIVEADHCPTCGQTVGKSHREHVRERNSQIMAEYEKQVAEINIANEDIDKQMQVLYAKTAEENAERTRIDSENAKIASQMRAIDIELAGLVDQELPAMVSEKPSPPEDLFDRDKLEVFRQQQREYDTNVTRYEFVQTQIRDAATKVEVIKKEITSLKAAAERLQKIESAIRQIPQEELKSQMKAFEMKTVTITVGEKVEVSKDGILYDCMSTGQQAKADVEICQKLNALMQKPINMIFLDNADLVDEMDWGNQQMFAAFVDKSVENVHIESVS